MTAPRTVACAAMLAALFSLEAAALPIPPLPREQPQGQSLLQPAKSILRDMLNSLADDDDYVHDRHYDWKDYRDSTSRKERVRDYYEMQREAQKDYWKNQKEMQKRAIKAQRGW